MNRSRARLEGECTSTTGHGQSAEQPQEPAPPDIQFRPTGNDLVMSAYLITHPWIDLQEWLEGQTL